MQEQDNRRCKDLLKAGELVERTVLGHALFDQITSGRVDRRPVGNSPRLWQRVAGEDPFESGHNDVTRRTVYADARMVRMKDPNPSKPSTSNTSQWAAPSAPAGRPKPRDGNLGESLIPEGFRKLPAASSTPAARPIAKRPPPPPPDAPPAPAPPPKVSASGRFRTSPSRTRTVLRTPKEAPPEPPPRPVAPPPVQPPKAPDPAPSGGDGSPDDLFGSPIQGRTRMKRRGAPKPGEPSDKG